MRSINFVHLLTLQLARGPCEALEKDPADDKARNTVDKINKTLGQLNGRHGYPKNWTIHVPPQPGVDGTGSTAADPSEAAASEGANKAGKSSTKGGVKTKVAVPTPDPDLMSTIKMWMVKRFLFMQESRWYMSTL